MNTKLFVGGLSFEIDSAGLRAEFEKFGVVTDVHMPVDRQTGRVRGFAFVTLGSEEECNQAIEKMNGAQLAGRTISVSMARTPNSSGPGGGLARAGNDDAAAFYARASRRER